MSENEFYYSAKNIIRNIKTENFTKIINNKFEVMTILDLIGLDIKNIPEDEFKVAYKGKNSEGKKYIDYEKSLSPKIFDIFDTLQIKIFADKFELSENNFTTIVLFKSKGTTTNNEIKKVTQILHQTFGKDSDGKKMWLNKDIQDLKIGFFKRYWDLSPSGETLNDITDDSYSVWLGYCSRNISILHIEPEYFSMTIWRANKIINKPIKKVNIPLYIENSSNSKGKSEGCFIATACYDDYDSTEVILLRKYRDEVLKKTVIGKLFIKFYYTVSPAMARVVFQSNFLKNMIKQLFLNPIILRIKNRVKSDC